AADLYDRAREVLGAAGFVHYEISNWGLKRGSEVMLSRHNRQYWRNLPYVGLGAGAHGYFQGIRYENIRIVADYIRRMRGGAEDRISPVVADQYQVDRTQEMGETMMMGLRLLQEGVSATMFRSRFSAELTDVYDKEINRLIGLGLLEWVEEGSVILRLTEKGYLLGNQVFSAFV
ncbi:MAG: coproporphyrinogen III oxidase family protein, partial [Anaerolineales bacterium]